jgi:hypothetical protein
MHFCSSLLFAGLLVDACALAQPGARQPLAPFVSLSGDHDQIRKSLRQVAQAGNTGLIVYPQVKHDYLGPEFWADAGVAVDEARRLSLDLYFADEQLYPSGIAGRKIFHSGRRRDRGGEWLFLHNRSVIDPVRTRLRIASPFEKIARYDAWEDKYRSLRAMRRGSEWEIELDLAPCDFWVVRISNSLPEAVREARFTARESHRGEWMAARAPHGYPSSGLRGPVFLWKGTR